MSLCVNFFFINKLKSQKTPFSTIIQLFTQKNAFYCKSHEIKRKGKKRKLQFIKCYEAKRIQAGYANKGQYIHYMEKGRKHIYVYSSFQ